MSSVIGTWQDLPVELISESLVHLQILDLLEVSLTSRRLSEIARPFIFRDIRIWRNHHSTLCLLLKHNCFFFSWTVLMVVSRHCLPYDIPQSTTLMARLESRIKPLTSAIVTEAVKLLDLIFEAVKIFRSKIDPSLREGVLSLNPKVLGFIWRRYCSLRLHLGFREQLVAQVEKQIRERIPSLYDRVIAIYTQANSVDSNLWIDDVKGDVESDIRTELSKILWDIALEAASSSVEGSLVNKKPGPGVPNRRLKFSVLGKGAAQFFAVVNDSFVAGISTGKVAGHGHNGTLSNEAVFDRVWEAASTTSLSVAQTVVAETNAQVNDPKRAALWEQMWSNWDDVMKECYIIVQPVFVGSMEKLTRSIVDIGGGTLIQEMKDSKKSSIRTRISQERRGWRRARLGASSNMTNAELQEYMQTTIKNSRLNFTGLTSSMSRIWKEAHQLLPPSQHPLAHLRLSEVPQVDYHGKHVAEYAVVPGAEGSPVSPLQHQAYFKEFIAGGEIVHLD